MVQLILAFILNMIRALFTRPASPSTADIQQGAPAAVNKMQSDILDKADEQAKEAVVDRGGADAVLKRLRERKPKA